VPHPRGRRRRQPAPGMPDLGTIARDAVVRFLDSEANAPAEPGSALPGVPGMAAAGQAEAAAGAAGPAGEAAASAAGAAGQAGAAGSAGVAAGQAEAERMIEQATRAAAVSVSALDRIEAAAAKLDADIAVARESQADLQARAGTAAEKAVRAAQAASQSAGKAEDASSRALATARRVGRYAIIAFFLVLLQLAIAAIFAVSAR
jgi:hypothetical protein